MAELKTKPTRASALEFLRSIDDPVRRKDAQTVCKLMRQITGQKPVMWGPSIVGFGHYHYRYKTGREGDWFLCGLSPRKTSLTVYIMPGFARHRALLSKLGKHKAGKGCLYIKRLDDVDIALLEQLIVESVAWLKQTYG